MRLQIISDMHLEFGPCEVPHTDADVVIAAGDIDQQTEGVEWLKSFNKPVIYVAGNHEFWGGDLLGSIDSLRKACQGSNIHFLENDQITIDDVTFFGCTLWTDFYGCDEWVLANARQCMNDFAYISHKGAAADPLAMVESHSRSLRWLQDALQKPSGSKRVVVTHHAPSLRSWCFNPEEVLRFAYCNQLEDIIHTGDIRLWAHGHVHCSSNYHIHNTRIVCNPRGYYRNNLVENFQPTKVVEI